MRVGEEAGGGEKVQEGWRGYLWVELDDGNFVDRSHKEWLSSLDLV